EIFSVRLAATLGPVQPAALECLDGVRIRNLLPSTLCGEGGESRKLVAPPVAHRRGEIALVIAEIQEGLRRRILLAHEQQRNLRRKQQDRVSGAQASLGRERRDSLAQGAIANLVMVLQEIDEGVRRQCAARLAARFAAECGPLSLIGEALREHAP